jgi:hypothetical protein
MTANESQTIGREAGQRLVKAAIAVVGLLVIRLVLGSLPMLKDANPIFVGGTANQDMSQAMVQAFQAAIAGRQAPQSAQDIAMAYTHGWILPISIANAIVDSLIFAVFLWTASGFNSLIRARSKRLPEGGLLILLLVLTVVVGLAYRSYMGVIPPLLGSEANLYGWFFLVLGLLPLIGLVVVASRNLDAITEVVFSSTSRAVAGARAVHVTQSSTVCSKCGNAVAAGVKFCSNCGASVTTPIPAEKFCSECGTKNEGQAKFCKDCGKPLGKT